MKAGSAVALLLVSGMCWAQTAPPATGGQSAGEQTQTTPKRAKLGRPLTLPRLRERVDPIYPLEAKQAHIQGVVKLKGTIDKKGSVINLSVISGNQFLIDSALEAARQWKYFPALLGDEPVTIATEIDVNYTLADVPQKKHPLTFEDLMAVKRISDPQISPDGRLVAYVETDVDVDANRNISNIWIVPTAGGEPRRLTLGSDSSSRPRWSPDGK